MRLARAYRNRVGGMAVLVVLAGASVACIDPGTGGTTTTASTTSTVPGSSTTINPDCDLYIPTAVETSTGDATSGDTITVTGNGVEGTTVVLKLRELSSSTVVDPGVTVAVGSGGSWSTPLTLPTLAPGVWEVVATAQGCTGEATAFLQIT
jgi:hypothetical protein